MPDTTPPDYRRHLPLTGTYNVRDIGGYRTQDGRITLQSVECLCACEAAPMAQVDDRYELNLTPDRMDRILEGLR